MSGGPAKSSGDGLEIHLGDNLLHAGSHVVHVAENTFHNTTELIYNTWKRVIGVLGDVIVKKPVSATLHLAGGPVAKIIDTTVSGVSKILGKIHIGKGSKKTPTAWLLRKLNSIVASSIDTVSNIEPTWTERKWHGFRGYFRHVGETLAENHRNIKKWKAEKKAQRRARRAEIAAKVAGGHHHAADHTHNDHHAHDDHKEGNRGHAGGHAKQDHGHVAEKDHGHEKGHGSHDHSHAAAEHAHADTDHGHTEAAHGHSDKSGHGHDEEHDTHAGDHHTEAGHDPHHPKSAEAHH